MRVTTIAPRRGREIPCDLLDLCAGDVAPRRQVVEVRVGDELAQFVYAGGEFGAVLPMLEALVENDLDHRQQQRPVLPGPHRQMDVRLLGGLGAQRVDDDDRGAQLLSFQRASPSAGHRLQPVPRAHRGVGRRQAGSSRSCRCRTPAPSGSTRTSPIATTCIAFWSTEPTKYRLWVPTASSQPFMKMMFDDEKPDGLP